MFYLRFLKGKQTPDSQFWTHYLENPAKSTWAGQTFEQVCKDHINQIKKAAGMTALLTDISSWRGKCDLGEALIDLVIDRRDRVINLCEIKFSVNTFTIDKDYEAKLRKKIEVFRQTTGTKKALQLIMITTNGVSRNKYSSIVQTQITLDDLFV